MIIENCKLISPNKDSTFIIVDQSKSLEDVSKISNGYLYAVPKHVFDYVEFYVKMHRDFIDKEVANTTWQNSSRDNFVKLMTENTGFKHISNALSALGL